MSRNLALHTVRAPSGGTLVWHGIITVRPSGESGKIYFTLPKASMTVLLKVWGQFHRILSDSGYLRSHTHSYKCASPDYNGFEAHWTSVATQSGHINSASAGTGVATTEVPKTVNLHVDGGAADNLWTNETTEQASGEQDISSDVSTAGEHYLELKETGAKGGQLQYEIRAS